MYRILFILITPWRSYSMYNSLVSKIVFFFLKIMQTLLSTFLICTIQDIILQPHLGRGINAKIYFDSKCFVSQKYRKIPNAFIGFSQPMEWTDFLNITLSDDPAFKEHVSSKTTQCQKTPEETMYRVRILLRSHNRLPHRPH